MLPPFPIGAPMLAVNRQSHSRILDAIQDQPAFNYLVATVCVALSVIIREFLSSQAGIYLVGVTFFPSVLIAALLGGLPVGLFAAALSVICLWFFAITPTSKFSLGYIDAAILIAYAISFVIVVALAAHYRTLRIKAETEKARNDLMLQELNHRVKNLLTVIQGMSHQIAKRTEGVQEFQGALDERLASLASTHQLLVTKNWQSIRIRDLLAIQVTPFVNPTEIDVLGQAIQLEPIAAEQLGLAFHELASNCVKYGAWKYGGKVSVAWKVNSDSTLELVWTEKTGASEESHGERKGFGQLVLTTIVPQMLLGSAEWQKTDDGMAWRVTIHSDFFTLQHSTSPLISDGAVKRA